jgi:adenine-specific DNA-methyltransferase
MIYFEPKEQIEKLIAKFRGLSARERKEYNEANTKNGFIQPLFGALGWDFSDINQVEAEKTIVKGRVDFICKSNGISKFCLEVKPLREELIDDDRRQAISYAYNKGVTWAVLTNFDRFQVFNAERESSDLNNILFLNIAWQNYLADFDDLRLLSRESVADNLLDKQATKYGKLPARIPIERRLYQHLREYREKLFNEIYYMHKDKGITLATTDNLIQALFNRLLFIRTAEDRDLAGNHPLLGALHRWRSERKTDFIEHLRRIFHNFVELYDSDLFPAILDPWEQIWVNSDLLSEIIQGLYEVPGDFARYDFSIIDVDVLGQVYEQYLGYVAQVAKEKAKEQQLRLEMGIAVPEVIKLEEKRKRRKAAGIYYTPRWVTDYIVKETVGRFLRDRSWGEALDIKILDLACGSGSFLIRSYDELLNYHAKIQGKTVAEIVWAERIKILLKNIYGVDLDSHAVEITRLNLLLRALAKVEALPSLAGNILCGNSLISGSDKELSHYFGDSFKDKKPFNWEERLPDIAKKKGFDIVIGNPPYLRPHKIEASEKQALWAQYQVYRAKSDIYACFIQRAIDLVKPGGYVSYIVSNTFMSLESFAPLRKYILDTCCILYFGLTPQKVFEDATVETIILGLKKENNQNIRRQNKILITQYLDGDFNKVKEIPQENFYSTHLNIFDLSWGEATLSLSSKIELNTDKLFECANFCYGLKTGDDTVFLAHEPTTSEHKKLLRRSDFARYSIDYKGEFVWYVPDKMREHRKTARPGNRERFEQPKILIQDIGKHLVATFDDQQFYAKDALILNQRVNGLDLKFLLALINSRLLNYWYSRKFRTLSVAKNAILELPIRRIDFKNPSEKKFYDELVIEANNMLKLTKKISEIEGEGILYEETQTTKRAITDTDNKIDQLVYQLYGLTENEINLID